MSEEISTTSPDLSDPRVHKLLDDYWRNNLRVMAVLLLIWAVSSFGCAIVFADWLNQFNLPLTGIPLGFWFAQQGSIVIFVLCILTYCIAMNRLDAKHHELLEQLKNSGPGA
jgi:putative solute:sodium symporter small subunit